MGKITKENGFIASDKDTIRKKARTIPKVDIKTFGVYNPLSTLISEETASFKAYFGETILKVQTFVLKQPKAVFFRPFDFH